MKIYFFGALYIAAALFSIRAHAQETTSIEAGEAIYDEHCSSCHGEKLSSSGSIPDLRDLRAGDRARFDHMLLEGKDQMPSFQGVLTAEEFNQLWAYVGSRRRSN